MSKPASRTVRTKIFPTHYNSRIWISLPQSFITAVSHVVVKERHQALRRPVVEEHTHVVRAVYLEDGPIFGSMKGYWSVGSMSPDHAPFRGKKTLWHASLYAAKSIRQAEKNKTLSVILTARRAFSAKCAGGIGRP